MNTKPWYQSVTAWAIKIALVLQFLPDGITWLDANWGLHLAANAGIIKALSIVALVVAWVKNLTRTTMLTATSDPSTLIANPGKK